MGEAVVVVRTEVDGSAVQFLLALEGAAVQATDQQRNPALDGVEPSSCRIASAFAKVRNGSPNQCSCNYSVVHTVLYPASGVLSVIE